MATTLSRGQFCVRREVPAGGFTDFPALHEWLAITGYLCETSRDQQNGRRYMIWHFDSFGPSYSFMRCFGGEPWAGAIEQRRAG